MTRNTEFYGLRSWRAWSESTPMNLRPYVSKPCGTWSENDVLEVSTFRELLRITAFLNVMNKRHRLAFRGQGCDLEPTPTMFRDQWMTPLDIKVDLAPNRNHYFTSLEVASDRVSRFLLEERRLPRWRPFKPRPGERQRALRVAPWSVLQHYELWPTPLIDLTTSLRVAASFALGVAERRDQGFVYAFAMEDVVSDVMMLSLARETEDHRFVAVRLSAVCPPSTERPHLQEGILAGDPRDLSHDEDPSSKSPVASRLVAKFRIVDRGRGGRSTFWDDDFPAHSRNSLLPEEKEEKGGMRKDLVDRMRYTMADGKLVLGRE